MTVDSIGVTTGTDKYLHTSSRSISAVTRHDQYVQLGEGDYPSYEAQALGISVATTAAHVLQVMADGTNYTRLKSVSITPTDDIPAAATVLIVSLVRLSTAGTGGSAVTARPFDTADTYAGGAMTLPSAKGTEGAEIFRWRVPLPAAHPFVSGGLIWEARLGVSSCTVDIIAIFSVTSYL